MDRDFELRILWTDETTFKSNGQQLENQVEAIPTSEANDALLAAQKSVKEQLLSPAIPPYIPPVVPNKDYSTEQYFTCKDCGDRFILESSLVRHLERRSVTILYGCRTCLQTVLFYNRCELLAHLRGHSEEANSAKTSESLNTAQGKATLASSISSNDHDYSAKNNDHDYSARNSVCSVDEDLEPDALSLSPLQKSKIALGPFVPIPMDAHGRIIRQKSNETRKSDVTVNQVTEGVNESSSAGQVKSVDNNHLQGRKEDTRQTQMSLNTGGQVSPFVVSTVAAVSKDRTIILKSKDNNQTKTASINPPVDLPEVPDESPIDMLGKF
ncbi:hypothetical protein ANN_09743 [Periplaneta americana]|uniref:C2H2-type domain-containing protein n=1 Tax=Periplaneta americana TaxID=6978 RepID=A0ABQ8TQS6_PERAM|nr:hypothetical protein ANN_09743 [Periplaneta americana]